MAKYKIEPGTICILDPKNFTNNNISDPIRDEIISLVKKKLFGNSIWRVKRIVNDMYDSKNTEVFDCSENILYPDGVVLLRIPNNIPIITENEIKSLESFIGFVEMNPTKISVNDMKNVKGMIVKLKQYREFTEV